MVKCLSPCIRFVEACSLFIITEACEVLGSNRASRRSGRETEPVELLLCQ